MKNIYKQFANHHLTGKFLLVIVILGGLSSVTNGQIIKPFIQRTSSYSPDKKIYNIKGDYTLIGNTNLTLATYSDNTNNSNNTMVYVDVDGDANTLNSSSANLSFSTENGAIPSCSNIIYAGLYWTGRAHDGTSANTFTVTKNSVTKTYNKQIVYIKGPGASSYTDITANANEIYYPTTTDGYMYSAYAEVTDYVKTHGIGNYTVADIALREGNGGGTGYYGGWGLVVIYENSKMSWRDVTLFDGHAYVQGSTTLSYELPISGFHTIQSGNVNMKLGMMAGEGDVSITGDYFQIINQNNSWVSLNHSGNTANNFFNGSIQTGGNSRNPNLKNNTGLDIAMFSIPNTNNAIITNNQTTTRFKYGSTQDTYIIFCIAMAVDAYIPYPEGLNTVQTINGLPPSSPPLSAQPDENIVYKMELRNKGTEAINNTRVVIPVPYTASYVSSSRNIYFTPLPSPDNLYFDPSLGANGSIVWDFGTLPKPLDPNTLLADLSITFKTTTDCGILANTLCNPTISVNGSFSGTGAISNAEFANVSFISGYKESGTCIGEPITEPIKITLNSAQYLVTHCQGTPPIRPFTYCNAGVTIPVTDVNGNFPAGSRFYNEYPVTLSSIEYTISNPFPATPGTKHYYAVPPGDDVCFFEFTITVNNVTTVPAVNNVNYCHNDTPDPLTATATNPAYTLYYYSTASEGTPQTSITPSTATVGTTTFYVAEGTSGQCISLNRAPLTVTVNANPVCSITGVDGPLCPSTSLTYTGVAGMSSYSWEITGNGSISGSSTSQSVNVISGNSGNSSFTLKLKVTNSSGCISNCTKTINVLDNTPPIVPILADITGECSATAPTATTTDVCVGTVTGTTSDALSYNTQGIHVIHWTFSDGNGNSSTANQNVIVKDVTAPVTPILADVTGECAATAPTATTTDVCVGTVTGTTPDALSYSTQGTHVIHWTFSDGNGNSSTANQNVIIKDVTAPVTPTLADVTGECAATAPTATTTDVCAGTVTGTTSDALSYSTQGTHVIHWTFSDGNGNSTTANQNVIVKDITAPVTPTLADVTGECSATAPTATTTDVCAGTVSGTTSDALSYSTQGTHVIHWTFSDGNGNSSTENQNVIVKDVTAPVTPILADVTGECAATAPTATTTDVCAGTVTGTTPDALSYSTQGTHVIHWTFSDGNGNSTTENQNVIVKDVTAPVTPILADVTGECAATAPTATTTDVCAGTVTGTTPDALSYSTQGTHVIHWTFSDGNGNSTTANQNVIVKDVTAPVTPILADVTGECAATAPTATTTDVCAGTVTGTTSDALSYSTQGTHVIHWTFSDGNGNSTTANQNVIVKDVTAPVTPILADVTGECAATAPTATTTDVCAGTVTGTTSDALSYSTQGTHVIHWTFSDGNGNSTTANQNVIVKDVTAPVTPILADVTGECAATAPTATTTDVCAGTVTGTTPDALSYSTQGTHVIHWTFSDGNGNSTTANQNVIVKDITAPVTPTLADVTGECSATAPTATTTDVCAGTVSGTTSDALSYSTQGTHVIHWTFSDGNGNSTTANQNVIVKDVTAPVTPTLADVTGECAATAPTATTTDVCAGTVSGTTSDALSYSTQGTHVIHWTFSDGNGNSSTANQNVIIKDVTAPVTPTLADVTSECAATAPTATTTDVCAGTVSGTTSDALSYSTQGTHVIHWTFSDGNGNSSTANQNVIIKDVTAPVTPTLADVTGECSATAPTATTTDACIGTVTGTTPDALSYSTQGTHVIHWTFSDGNGNSSTANQNVIVKDVTTPVTPILADVTGECAATAPTATTTDVCAGTVSGTTSDALSYSTQGTHVIHWTFSDGNGNSSTANQNVIVKDVTAPVTPTLADVTGQCSSTATVPSTTDNCTGTIIGTTSDPLTYSTQGTHVITWRFDDGNGNISTATQNVIIKDVTEPVAPVLADVTGECSATAPVPTTTDDCTGISILGTTVDPLTYNTQGTHVIHWSFDDGNGNISTTIQNVVIKDNISPVIDPLPSPSTINCPDTPVFAVATAIDACDPNPTLTFVDAITSVEGDVHYNTIFDPNSPPTIDAIYSGSGLNPLEVGIKFRSNSNGFITGLRYYKAAGMQGVHVGNLWSISGTNLASATFNQETSSGWQTVTLTTPVAITANTIYIVSYFSPHGDFVKTDPYFSTDQNNGPLTALGSTTVEPNGIYAYSDNSTFPNNNAYIVSSNYWADVLFSSVPSSDAAPSYTITRTWTATDASGNSSTASQAIKVQDVTAPVFATLPATTTIDCPSIPEFATATATDDCGSAFTLIYNDVKTDGDCTGSYSITRTWTAKDVYGNTSSASQTINVQDIMAPTLSEAPANVTVDCSDIPAAATLTATDNCDSSPVVIFAEVRTNGNCANTYTLNRTWSATDACGNTSSTSQIILVQDITAPVLAGIPADTTVECSELGNLLDGYNLTVNGNFEAGNSGFTGNYAYIAPAADNLWLNRGKYTIYNDPNFVHHEFYGPDHTTGTGNMMIVNGSGGVGQVVWQEVLPVIPNTTYYFSAWARNFNTTGNQAHLQFSINNQLVGTDLILPYLPSFQGPYNWIRFYGNWTSNSATSATLQIVDLTTSLDYNDFALDDIKFGTEVTATDNCDNAPVVTKSPEVRNDGNCANSYTLTNTWTAKDACGNTSTASQTITVQDITAPVIAALPESTTINCPAEPEFAVATAIDECGSGVTLTFVDVKTDGSCAGSYSVTRTWTATDACGNTSTASQTINVQDITAPILSEAPANVTVDCSDIPSAATLTATDNCDSSPVVIFAEVRTNGNCANTYTLNRTWSATDACGNTSSASQIILVQDITAPVLAGIPADTTVECSELANLLDGYNLTVNGNFEAGNSGFTGNYAYIAPAADNLWLNRGKYTIYNDPNFVHHEFYGPDHTTGTGNMMIVNGSGGVGQVVWQEILPVIPNTTYYFSAWARNFNTTGNQAHLQFSINNQLVGTDLILPYLPSFQGPYNWVRFYGNWTSNSATSATLQIVDLTTSLDYNDFALDDIKFGTEVTATDNCDNAPIVSKLPEVRTDGNCANSYTLTNTWTAKDACGNSSSKSQVITVKDITAPVISTLPTPSTINCPAVPEFTVATVTDGCDANPSLSYSDAKTDGNCAGSYSVTRTWTAKDACGNTSTASQTINVQDITAPVIAALPAPTTIDCPAVPEFASATASDDCGSAFTLTFDDVKTDGDCAGSYSVTRTWTAKDACGNTSTASQTINVQDITAPVIAALPAPTTIDCPAVPEFAAATATDDCGSAFTLTFNDVKTDGDCAGSYSVTRTWTAKDACGNTSTASQTVNVQDISAPVIAALPATSTIDCPAVPEFATATAMDDCGSTFTLTYNDVKTDTKREGTCPGSYSITRTWTATDACGNTSTASQTITVQDITAPVLSEAPANVTVECNAVPVAATLTATDNCDAAPVVTFTEVRTNGNCPNNYSLTRTWTATDACLNTSSVSQVVTVQSLSTPVLTCPANIAVNNDPGVCGATVTVPKPTVTVNCGSYTLSNSVNQTADASGLYPIGTTTVEWTVTDECGNTSKCSMTVTVTDNEKPVITCPTEITICSGEQVVLGTATATDNCGITGITNNAPATFEPGTTLVVWTATDNHGNASTCTQTITITPKVTVNAGPDAPLCSGLPYTLSGASAANYASVSWTHNGHGSLSNANILNPVYTPSAGENGAIEFTLTAKGTSACGSMEATDKFILSISPAIIINAGADKTIVSGTATSLAGTVSGGSGVFSYTWTPAEYLVTNTTLTPGTLPLNSETVFTLTAIDAISGCSASDEVKISVDNVERPIARDDYATTDITHSLTVDVMTNDSDPIGLGLTISITTAPKVGTATLNENGTITYTNSPNYTGKDIYDTLTYTICDKGSPSKCASARLIITIIKERLAFEVYNLVTPNGDGQNDFWHIDGIEEYPENEIILFNQWGDKVNEFKGYNNASNHWDGNNENGNLLPSGTYFYIIKLNDEAANPNSYTGWVLLRGKEE